MKNCKRCAVEILKTDVNYKRKIFCGSACVWAWKESPVGIQERFWSYVRKTEGCWLYEKTLDKDGYGYFRHGHRSKLVQWFAHRFSWTLANGDVPAGMCVCHTCDVRNCVNPSHLFLGSHTDNMRDMQRKGRNGTAHLNPDQVLEIRAALAKPYFGIQIELSRKYNVKRGVISDIYRGYTYQHVSPFAAGSGEPK